MSNQESDVIDALRRCPRIWTDPVSGAMIRCAVDEINIMAPKPFASRPGAPARAGAALAKLHGSGQTCQFRFELSSMIDDHLKMLSTKVV